MNFFTDNTFAPALSRAAALIAGRDGHAFLHMLDLYRADPGDDTIWIPEVAKKAGDWIVLSGDRALFTTPQNRQALEKHRLPAFVMPSGFPDHHRWQQASKFFKYLPEIVNTARRMKRGELFSLQENGKVRKWT